MLGSNFGDRIAEIHREILNQLPSGKAEFVEERTEFPGGTERICRMIPRDEGASPTTVVYVEGDDQVSIELGRDTLIERSAADDDRAGDDLLREITAILTSVIFDGFSESIWVSGDDVVRSEAAIDAGHEPIRARARHVGRGSLSRAKKQTINYKPY
jgi:hypothetical protein